MQTKHPVVFIIYVEASSFVAEVIGQKQSLVFIDIFLFFLCGENLMDGKCSDRLRFVLFFSSLEDWLQCSDGPNIGMYALFDEN